MSVGPTAARPWFVDRARRRRQHPRAREPSDRPPARSRRRGDEGAGRRRPTCCWRSPGGAGRHRGCGRRIVLRFASGAVGTIVLAWTRAGLPGSYSLDVVAAKATLATEARSGVQASRVGCGERHVKTWMTVHPFERLGLTLRRRGPGRRPERRLLHAGRRDGDARDGARGRALLLEGGRVVELSAAWRVIVATEAQSAGVSRARSCPRRTACRRTPSTLPT